MVQAFEENSVFCSSMSTPSLTLYTQISTQESWYWRHHLLWAEGQGGQATVHPGSIVTQTDSMTIHLDTAYRVERFSFLSNALRIKRDTALLGHMMRQLMCLWSIQWWHCQAACHHWLCSLGAAGGFGHWKAQTNNKNHSDHLLSTYSVQGTLVLHLFPQPP